MYEFCQKDLRKSFSPKKSENPPIMKKSIEKFSFVKEPVLLFKNVSGIAKTACVQRAIDEKTVKRILSNQSFVWLKRNAPLMKKKQKILYIDKLLNEFHVEVTDENRQQIANLLGVAVALPAAPPPPAYDREQFDTSDPDFPWGIPDDIMQEIIANKTRDKMTVKDYGDCFHFGGHQSYASPKAFWQIVGGKIRLFGLYLHRGNHYDKQAGPGPDKIQLK